MDVHTISGRQAGVYEVNPHGFVGCSGQGMQVVLLCVPIVKVVFGQWVELVLRVILPINKDILSCGRQRRLGVNYEGTIQAHPYMLHHRRDMAVIHQGTGWCCDKVIGVCTVGTDYLKNTVLLTGVVTMHMHGVGKRCLVDEMHYNPVTLCCGQCRAGNGSVICPCVNAKTWGNLQGCVLGNQRVLMGSWWLLLLLCLLVLVC